MQRSPYRQWLQAVHSIKSHTFSLSLEIRCCAGANCQMSPREFMLTPETAEKERGKKEPELPLAPHPLITSQPDAAFDKICKIHIRVRIFMEGRHQV